MPSELFGAEWMAEFGEKWNVDPLLCDKLGEINFCSIICYGYKREDTPRGIMKVENGRVVSTSAYNGETEYNWDIRMSPSRWSKTFSQPMDMKEMAVLYVKGQIKFETGNYSAMISNPSMAGPFIHSFTTMASVDTLPIPDTKDPVPRA
jgi:hypothetical protein